jgi:hypothetical protein
MFRRLQFNLAFGAMLLAIGAITLAVVSVFICMGIYLEFCEHTTPAIAAFATAGCALLFLGSVALIAWIAKTLAMRRRREFGGFSALEIGQLLGSRFGAAAGENSWAAIAASLSAGFAVGASPRLRAALLDILGL